MTVLHTVNKSPFECRTLESCFAHALDGSVVLFIEDGVYAALAESGVSELVSVHAERLKVYALESDLDARGIVPARRHSAVDTVDYQGFVSLAVECDVVQAWL